MWGSGRNEGTEQELRVLDVLKIEKLSLWGNRVASQGRDDLSLMEGGCFREKDRLA